MVLQHHLCLVTLQKLGDAATGEGAVAAQSANYGSATTAGVNVSYGGLTAGAFGEEVQNDQGDATEDAR